MRLLKDLTGLRFGRLVVQWPAGKRGTLLAWLCLCDCGVLKIVLGSNLPRTGSCGCIKKEEAEASTQKKAARVSKKKIATGKCLICSVVLTLENSTPSFVKRKSGYCNICRRDSGMRDEEQKRGRLAAAVLRDRVFNKLGHVCYRCGFSDRRALQIDHKNGGGIKDHHRHSQTGYFKYILANLELFQMLCCNCNWIKRYENNECPKKILADAKVSVETYRQKLKGLSDDGVAQTTPSESAALAC